MSRIRALKNIALSGILALVTTALAWTTPGFMLVTTRLVRSTATVRIIIKTYPNELNDVLEHFPAPHPNLSGGARSECDLAS
jgi:hypothetical protein